MTTPKAAPSGPRRLRPTGDDEGTITLFFAVIVVALFVAVGLVVDGAGRVRALQSADNAAQEAARAAGQALDGGDVVEGLTPTFDTAAGARSARSYLEAAGVEGTVSVSGQTITVRTTAYYDPVFLVGAGRMALTGQAVARPARGVDQEEAP